MGERGLPAAGTSLTPPRELKKVVWPVKKGQRWRAPPSRGRTGSSLRAPGVRSSSAAACRAEQRAADRSRPGGQAGPQAGPGEEAPPARPAGGRRPRLGDRGDAAGLLTKDRLRESGEASGGRGRRRGAATSSRGYEQLKVSLPEVEAVWQRGPRTGVTPGAQNARRRPWVGSNHQPFG